MFSLYYEFYAIKALYDIQQAFREPIPASQIAYLPFSEQIKNDGRLKHTNLIEIQRTNFRRSNYWRI